jgi:hypothetical protein
MKDRRRAREETQLAPSALLLPSKYKACSCEIPPQHRHPLRRTPRMPGPRPAGRDPGLSHNMSLYVERLLCCHAHCFLKQQAITRSARASLAGILHAIPSLRRVERQNWAGSLRNRRRGLTATKSTTRMAIMRRKGKQLVRCPYCLLAMWDKKLPEHVRSRCPKRSRTEPPPSKYVGYPIGGFGPPPAKEGPPVGPGGSHTAGIED